MPIYPLKINNIIFSTKEKLREKVLWIITKYSHNTQVNDDDKKFLCELLKYHPYANEKIGAGIGAIKVCSSDRSESLQHKAFVIIRVDGTTTDFSYAMCLSGEPLTPKRKLCKILRIAVNDDLKRYRDQELSRLSKDGVVWCKYEKRYLPESEFNVDHVIPFSKLVKKFINLYNLDIDKISYAKENLGCAEVLADKYFEHCWIQYHRRYALLKLINKRINTLKGDDPHYKSVLLNKK